MKKKRNNSIFKTEGVVEILEITGIVLAGGKSSRMGKNKAFLEIDGKPLIERNLATLESLFSDVLISSNTPELYRSYKEKVVQDQYIGTGPLGGLHACLEEAHTEYAFFVACDIPILNPELIRFMASLTEKGYDCIVPRTKDRIHPLFALYNKSCLPKIKDFLQEGHYKVIDFFPQLSVRYVKENELACFGDPRLLLCNVNTPEDWLNFQKKLVGKE
ncbi:molybdenum cofactor guanylyltransferase [Desulfitobacterium sp.]|uniref:molybdenum cofactor guanylyltransferase n=1 Tax=Desulfitobacterium sp. TaxID=49981 RepID=UPI002B1E9C14|nr:molybdenum cofactor guanylyltransferase [Desulfitobacterium sp.]MEA4901822.1 molybdenum cofactor guanylyltransferase [Desulfitobacterium sp.]